MGWANVERRREGRIGTSGGRYEIKPLTWGGVFYISEFN